MITRKNIIAATLFGVLSLGSLVGLAACSTTHQQETAYTASTVYAAAHKIVVQYANGTFGKVDPNIVKTLVTLDKNASDALVTVDTAYANGTSLTAAAGTVAGEAVQALVTYIDQHHIGKGTK